MFLDGEWPGVQRERVAERGKPISGESPRHELAQRESYDLDEKGTDNDIGNLMKGKYNTWKRIQEPRTSQHNDGVEGRYDRG